MSPAITIREALEDEMPLIKRLSVGELPDELNEDELRDLDEAKETFASRLDVLLKREGNEIFVAEAENEPGIVGYVWFGVSERPFSTMRVGWIYDILVVPSHRGKGVGEALMRRALEVSKKRGFKVTGLMVRSNNGAAHSLYEKLGFQDEHIIMSRREKAEDIPRS